ncbi:MAG: hypothetical protein WCL00_10445 [Bacteroidota bacterium]
MKHTSVFCPVFLLITVTFIFGCKKDDTQDTPASKDYSGNYSFITTSTSYPDSAVSYDGSIYFDKTSKVLTVNYFEEIYTPSYPYTIYPMVDDKGVLSYPDWAIPQSGYFFNGNIDYDGNINFKIGLRIIHQGQTIESSRTVTGKKKQV